MLYNARQIHHTLYTKYAIHLCVISYRKLAFITITMEYQYSKALQKRVKQRAYRLTCFRHVIRGDFNTVFGGYVGFWVVQRAFKYVKVYMKMFTQIPQNVTSVND